MMDFNDPKDMDLDAALRQLGLADYTYIQTSAFIERLEQYRSALLTRIDQIHGNGESVDSSTGLRKDFGKQNAK